MARPPQFFIDRSLCLTSAELRGAEQIERFVTNLDRILRQASSEPGPYIYGVYTESSACGRSEGSSCEILPQSPAGRRFKAPRRSSTNAPSDATALPAR